MIQRLASCVVLAGGLLLWGGCSSDDTKPADDALSDAADTRQDAAGDASQDVAQDQTGPDVSADLEDASDVQTPPTSAMVQAGVYSLAVDSTAMEAVLSRDGEPVLRLDLAQFAAGVVDAVDDVANYDPYPYLVKAPLYTAPAGLAFVAPSAVTLVDAQSTSLAVRLDYQTPGEGGEAFSAQLLIDVSTEGRFKIVWTPQQTGRWAIFRITSTISPDEGLYGLGEFFDQVNHRGKIRAMQLEADGSLESAYNEAHVPIPLLIGTAGWGLFVETPYPGAFDFSGEPSRFDAYFGTGTASGLGLTFYVMSASHPLDLTRHYYDLTGYPRLPARWALGPWVWRDESKDQAEVESDINLMRDLDLPASGYWIDRPYATAVNTFDFLPSQFPDADAMITLLHNLGFRTALWHTPYLDEKDDATQELRNQAIEGGYYPMKFGLLLNKWGKPIDLTNPEAYSWWQELIRRYTDRGVEGFKLDYAEDVVVGLSGKRLAIWEFFNGEDERTMHERYNIFYHKVYAETLPEEGGFLLCRHGAPGDQVNGTIIWPGDLDADMSHHQEQVTGEDGKTYGAVGGLPAAVTASISLGPSGFPFFGSDTGGYRHSPPDEETFIRWFEHTALSTVMQIGTSSNDVAWEMFNQQSDPDGAKLALYRTMTRLHLRLFPYEWTYARNLLADGRAIQRPLGLAHPELGVHPSDEYLFGDDLLVAPVVNRGQVEREVHFPAGKWLDWWSGDVVEGGETRTVEAPLEKLPLYLAQGGIIPLLRPTIDTLAPTTQTERVDSMATDAGVLFARVFAGADRREFTLYDGAVLAAQESTSGVTLEYIDGEEFNQGAVFEVMHFGPTAPGSVMEGETALTGVATLDELYAAESGWYLEEGRGGVLWIKVPAGERIVVVE